jgi:ATPase subunit of ABC transporter with duplicated ATPase domains
MTPDLMEAGAKRVAEHETLLQTASSGDREASFGRVLNGAEPDFAHGVALYLDGITVSFDGFRALNNLNLAIDVGELRCIIGPNGAGKTTMMDVITGKTRPDRARRSSAPTSTCCACARTRSPRSASAASSRSPRCSRSSRCSRTWSWRSRPTAGPGPACSPA